MDDYQERLDHLRAWEGHRNYSLAMLDGMEMLARSNDEYRKRLHQWLRDGDTLLLRDVLADPFTVNHDMTTMAGKLAHFNAWACLDSVGMHSRDAIKEGAWLT